MNTVFDTLAFAKKLQVAGVSESVAVVHAEALAEMAGERLATKDDVMRLEERLTYRIEKVEDKFEKEIEKVTYQLTIRLGSLLTLGIVLVGALHKLFN